MLSINKRCIFRTTLTDICTTKRNVAQPQLCKAFRNKGLRADLTICNRRCFFVTKTQQRHICCFFAIPKSLIYGALWEGSPNRAIFGRNLQYNRGVITHLRQIRFALRPDPDFRQSSRSACATRSRAARIAGGRPAPGPTNFCCTPRPTINSAEATGMSDLPFMGASSY